MKPIYYSQKDSRWGRVNYSAPGEKKTIAAAGCGPTCAAMVIASLKDNAVNPITACNWSMDRGYKAKNQGTYYTYLVPQLEFYGIKSRRLNTANVYKKNNSVHNEAKEELKKGNWIIACMGKGNWTTSGHYVLAYALDGENVLINDPASTLNRRTKNTWALFSSEVKYYWAVELPKTANYTKEDFQSDICRILDSSTVAEALDKTITVSSKENSRHKIVTPLERYTKAYGLYWGEIEEDNGKVPVFGANMTKAVNDYQKNYLKYKRVDGEITAKGKMWEQMLT